MQTQYLGTEDILKNKEKWKLLAVRLCHQWPGFLVREDWGYFPVQAFSPFGGMLITSISTIGFHQNPAFYGAGSMESIHGLAVREGGSSRKKLSGGNFVIPSLERPVH